MSATPTPHPILAPVAAITLPDAQSMTTRAEAALAFIRELRITCAEDYSLAAEELQAVKARSKMLEAQRTSITGPINDALRAINGLFRGPAAALEEAERVLKRALLDWDAEQARIAAEQRRVAEQAAAAERARLAAQAAEREREAREQAAAAAAAAAAGDAQAAQSARAESERLSAQAQSDQVAAQLVVAAPPAAAPARAAGVSTATTIDYEIVDLLALVRHVAEHPELLALVAPDSVRLRAYVRGLGASCALPGVRVTAVQTMRARASR